MTDEPDMPREIEMVGELAEMDLAAAKICFRRLQAAETTEDDDAFNETAKTYQQSSRTVRMSLMLREQMLQNRKEPDAAEVEQRLWRERDAARIERRKNDLRTALRRVILCESEGERADYLCELLEERLYLHGRSPAFGMRPLDHHLGDLSDSLGFPPGASNDWRNLPDWPDEADEPQRHDAGPPEPFENSG